MPQLLTFFAFPSLGALFGSSKQSHLGRLLFAPGSDSTFSFSFSCVCCVSSPGHWVSSVSLSLVSLILSVSAWGSASHWLGGGGGDRLGGRYTAILASSTSIQVAIRLVSEVRWVIEDFVVGESRCDVFFADLSLILLHCCDKYELIASIDRFFLCCK
jgi:hypothetical protein